MASRKRKTLNIKEVDSARKDDVKNGETGCFYNFNTSPLFSLLAQYGTLSAPAPGKKGRAAKVAPNATPQNSALFGEINYADSEDSKNSSSSTPDLEAHGTSSPLGSEQLRRRRKKASELSQEQLVHTREVNRVAAYRHRKMVKEKKTLHVQRMEALNVKKKRPIVGHFQYTVPTKHFAHAVSEKISESWYKSKSY